MKLAFQTVHPMRGEDLQWRVTYGLLLPLFVVAEGLARLYSRCVSEADEFAHARGSWGTEARSQAAIATSYALMAKSMLQSSERRSRPERLSRH